MKIFTEIENFFKKIFGSTKWEKTASATITVLAPLTEELIAQTAGEADSADVAKVVGQVQSDLAAVTSLINASGPNANILSILNAIKTNISSLLTAGQIKNQATLTKVTTTVNLIVSEIEAIISVIPAAAAAATPAAAA